MRHHDPRRYWRPGNFHPEILEVEIDLTTVEVVSVVLLLPGKASGEFLALHIPADWVASGYPVVNVSDGHWTA